MKEYSVVPNKDMTGWYVKIEDVAPTNIYDERSQALDAAEKIAKENSPSKVLILDADHNVEEEKEY